MLARSIRLRQIGAASAVAAGTGWYWSQQQGGTAAVASADAEMAPVDLVSSSVCKCPPVMLSHLARVRECS